jgi:hypothetical protein
VILKTYEDDVCIVTVQAVRESCYCISWCVLFCVAVVIALYRAFRVVCLHDVSMIVIGVDVRGCAKVADAW